MSYGDPPVEVGDYVIEDWDELLHYLYLPVHIPEQAARGLVTPRRLAPLRPLVAAACRDFWDTWRGAGPRYVYLTARRGYATPDNPLNRPGWHCDGFGTDDVNYTWCDRWPTRWVDLTDLDPADVFIPDSHVTSLDAFDLLAGTYGWKETLPGVLYRLSPHVIHAVPDVPAPGGMRSFVKVSISKHRYNLRGNSHNYDLEYDWEMHDRAEMRNDPHRAQSDFYA